MKNYLDKFSLENKTAFVFGGTGLIGSHITEAFLSAGAKVYILDIDMDRLRYLDDIMPSNVQTLYSNSYPK